jgi:uncharacterized membrane protein YkoI
LSGSASRARLTAKFQISQQSTINFSARRSFPAWAISLSDRTPADLRKTGERRIHFVADLVLERFGCEPVERVMKKKSQLLFGFTVVSVFALVATISAKGLSQAELTQQAKITKAHAEEIAMAKVPHGSVQSAEIENEKGRLVWSFDIARPGTRDITEILVDANTGKIISTQAESPRDQAKEAAADKKQN